MIFRSNTLTQLQNKNEKAFEEIYRKYYKLVFYVALQIVKDDDIAQDIMQDTFIKFMKQIDHYEDQGKIKQYLTTISKNLALNYVKKAKKEERYDDTKIGTTKKLTNKTDLMLTLKKTLTPEESQIVTLKVLFDYSFKEIGEELNQSLGTIQGKYYKAIDKLKIYFAKEGR
ncbi:MAG: RNA polymerase sigma factor [Bacilli bacterium]